MTFGNDYLCLMDETGERRVCAASLDLEWPPPKRLEFLGLDWRRVYVSPMTDEARDRQQAAVRGAVYERAS